MIAGMFIIKVANSLIQYQEYITHNGSNALEM